MPIMTVNELVNYFIEPSYQKVVLYDIETTTNVFVGFVDDIPTELSELEVCSIDNIEKTNVFTINVLM